TVETTDVFVAKIASDGTWKWVQSGGGQEFDEGRAIAARTSGIFISGSSGASANFGVLAVHHPSTDLPGGHNGPWCRTTAGPTQQTFYAVGGFSVQNCNITHPNAPCPVDIYYELNLPTSGGYHVCFLPGTFVSNGGQIQGCSTCVSGFPNQGGSLGNDEAESLIVQNDYTVTLCDNVDGSGGCIDLGAG